jgi:hypothetical protein
LVNPENKDIQAFLGFCNFYHHFIKDFGKISKLVTLLMGNVEFNWGIPQQLAYEALKEAVAKEVVLYIPKDVGKFMVEVDASGYAMGVVLSQLINGKWRPVVFMSKAFNKAEWNYDIYDKETLAIMKALEEWWQFLIGAEEEFEVWTDHLNLIYFWQPQKLNWWQAQWLLQMVDYQFSLHHKPGEWHAKPDFLSKHPAYDKGEHDNENVTLLREYHFREMTVDLKTIGEEYWQWVCQGMKNGLEDWLVAAKLAKKTKGWRKLPDRVVAVEEHIYVPRDEQLRQEIIWGHHNSRVAGHPGRYKTQ